MTTRHFWGTLALAAGLALGGCAGGGDDEETAATDDAALNETLPEPNSPAVEEIVETEAPRPQPATRDDDQLAGNASVIAPPPDAPVSEDVQMQEDAEASGMTARLPADGDDAPANEVAE